jgi:hypothetical protein
MKDLKSFPKFTPLEYKGLRTELYECQREIRRLQDKLKGLKEDEKVLRSVYEPKVTITEAKNRSYGNVYSAKFRLYLESKPKLVTLYIGSVDQFTDKDDPKLREVVEKKVRDSISKHLESSRLDIVLGESQKIRM